MLNSIPDLDKATIDIDKVFIESTWDIVAPDVVSSCIRVSDPRNRNVSGFNIQLNPPCSLESVDPVNAIRFSFQVFSYRFENVQLT